MAEGRSSNQFDWMVESPTDKAFSQCSPFSLSFSHPCLSLPFSLVRREEGWQGGLGS